MKNDILLHFLNIKIQIFWEGHNNLVHLPLLFWHYLLASIYKWKMGQIFVGFSEYLNFMWVVYDK